jgi:flagellar protein FliO/FliZ
MLETGLGTTGKYILAILLVFALIGLIGWLLRQFTAARRALAGGGRNRQPRLAVLDSAPVDARRRLVLIRRDNVEHLLLIGGPSDVVVEMNIVRATAVAPLAPIIRTRGEEPTGEATPAPIAEVEPAIEAQRAESKMPRTDPQYLEMQKKLEAAMTKPEPEAVPMPKVEPRPTAAAAAPVEPRLTPPPPAAPVPPVEPKTAPEPVAAPRYAERVEPRPVPPTPAPAPEVTAKPKAPEPFVSLEEEMASLLRPGSRPQ